MKEHFALDVAGLRIQRGSGPDAFRIFVPRLRLRRGRLAALVGRSGSGKSTLLEALAFLRSAHIENGHFLVSSRDRDVLHDVSDIVTRGRSEDLAMWRARSIGYVPQTFALLPYVSARTNMMLAVSRADGPAVQRVHAVAAVLGIDGLLDRLPEQLSVGQRQRVAIGRALVTGAPVLLVDEPTAALDRNNAEAVGRLLLETARRDDVAVLVATHDEGLVALCDERFAIVLSGNQAEVYPA